MIFKTCKRTVWQQL